MALAIIIGVVLFAIPVQVIGGWPWQMKALATRFLAGVFLAIAVAVFLAQRRSSWQDVHVMFLFGAAFFGLSLLVGLINFQNLRLNSIVTWQWFNLNGIVTFGCAYYLFKHRKDTSTSNPGMIRKPLKLFLIAQSAVVGVFGLVMYVAPDLTDFFWPWVLPRIAAEAFGALFLTTSLTALWSARQTDEGRIRAFLVGDALFPALALVSVAIHWDTVLSESAGWHVTLTWIALYAFVSLGSAYFYLKRPTLNTGSLSRFRWRRVIRGLTKT